MIAKVANLESVSIHKLFQFLSDANFTARMIPKISAYTALAIPMLKVKQPMFSPLMFLNILAQAVLHFTQFRIGGCYKTSMIKRALL